ncbi:MAG: hypothetical protein EXQ70_08835 [Solirubrobacterales bacterium]|nr:hypothetical protein [Solirubrobacterales bacterium]
MRVRESDSFKMQPPLRGPRRLLSAPAQALQKGDMRRLGRRRTSAIARRVNRRGGRSIEFRRRLYEERFDRLLEENGGVPTHPLELCDGFAIDRSGMMPLLDSMLAAGAELIDEYGAQSWEQQKPFLQNINPEDAVDRHPALLDFVTSSAMLAAVAPCFGYVPLLSGLVPRGVRLMESSTRFDPKAEGPWRESQLYNLDYHSSPTLYVVVALRDIGPDDGPLHFLGRAASRRVAEALDYGARGVPYRLSDEQVHALVDESEVNRFSEPAGTVLLIESSACFHFGSRRPGNDRYQMQYAFVSPVRNDFLELWLPQRVYPAAASDPDLRRLALDRSLLALG